MGTPEAVVADLLDQVTKASKEAIIYLFIRIHSFKLDQLVKEMSPMNRAIETLKKETKDQGCSPIRLPEAGEVEYIGRIALSILESLSSRWREKLYCCVFNFGCF